MAAAPKSEGIGLIGEQQFRLLCARADLSCNKSIDVDDMGWDFIVEFPMSSADPALPLDQRLNTSAKVQLKTTMSQADARIELTLSAIERLIKDPGPAVIVVFRLGADTGLLCGYVVHLIDRKLARVLHRLRQAAAAGVTDINRKSISFDYVKEGVYFEPSHEGLANALKTACGSCPATYRSVKQQQLADIGYENGRIEVEAHVQIEGEEHFRSLLLGLEPLRPHRLRLFDTRFGIRLPYLGSQLDGLKELYLTPLSLGRCEILIRGTAFGEAARFEADIVHGLPLADLQGHEVLIRSSSFMVRLTPNEADLSIGGSIDDFVYSLEEWAELLRALTLMANGGATLSIHRGDGNCLLAAPCVKLEEGPYLQQLPLMSAFADGWRKLLANAGLRSTSKFKIDAFWDAREACLATDLLLNPETLARIDLQGGDTEDELPPEALFYNNASFVDTHITFSARASLVPSPDPEWRYRVARFDPLEVCPKVPDLKHYGLSQAEKHGIRIVVDLNSVSREPSGAGQRRSTE